MDIKIKAREFSKLENLKTNTRNFPGGPVVKNPPSNEGHVGLILDQRTKIPHALEPKNQNIKQKQYCNKLNKDFKRKE